MAEQTDVAHHHHHHHITVVVITTIIIITRNISIVSLYFLYSVSYEVSLLNRLTFSISRDIKKYYFCSVIVGYKKVIG